MVRMFRAAFSLVDIVLLVPLRPSLFPGGVPGPNGAASMGGLVAATFRGSNRLAVTRRISRGLYVWIFIGLAVLLYAAIWSFNNYRLLALQLAGLGGVAPGDTHGDVRYKRGDPPFVYGVAQPGEATVRVYYTDRTKDPANALPEGSDVDSYPTWSYAKGPSMDIRVDVTFDPKTGRATKIDCIDRTDPPTFYCGAVAGIGIWDLEARIAALLGKPTRQWIDDKSGIKTMEYGDIGAIFLLRQQRVYGLSLTGTRPDRPIPMGRFLGYLAGTLWLLWVQP
jgi:hypothetical protein